MELPAERYFTEDPQYGKAWEQIEVLAFQAVQAARCSGGEIAMSTSHFPDRQHVEAIQRALWAGPDRGRAAVMVGAGMSRNAEPKRSGCRVMPTWGELVRGMIADLYPSGIPADRRRKELEEQAWATSTALRVAEEYVSVFGRPALDALLKSSVPDEDYAPGLLHRLLLELPWVDVLTTNIDTLLERAGQGTLGSRYSVVQSPEDIVSAARPRIVKLHGSLPASRPFVFTEEDFRTYPKRLSAFVNLAQQVAMENVLCLIGFSGDDPNFLYWSGWVRDNLGEHSPKLYLCGLLGFSDSQRLTLHRRNVVPVDLTPMFPEDRYPDVGKRHRAALEWLFLSLRNGRPYNLLDWPRPRSSVTEQPSHLPELLLAPVGSCPRQE